MADGEKRARDRWIARGTEGLLRTLAVLALAVVLLLPRPDGDGDLTALEQRIAADHPDVPQLQPVDLAPQPAQDGETVVFDVREVSEFAVSRVPGAVRIDPSIDAAGFLAAHGDRIAGRTIVLYCSVGVRSARLASRLRDAVSERGAAGFYNLSGGIFRWHNERRTLVDGAGETDAVHPYDEFWRNYLRRAQSARSTPEPRS